MNPTLIRVISAVFAATLILITAYFWHEQGLMYATVVTILLGLAEFSQMAFFGAEKSSRALNIFFLFLAVLTLIASCFYSQYRLFIMSLMSVCFLTGGLWICRQQQTNEKILSLLALGLFGMIYCIELPLYALDILRLADGERWFFLMLFSVLFGDIFAYFGGRWFGEAKLMPAVSPKKTIIGAISSVLGTVGVSLIYIQMCFPDQASVISTIIYAVCCSIFAQSGDLLMSLVKRVAQVKDSGTIMPGHGGILDRLDGVFISCPIVYAFAYWTQHQ